MRKTIGIIGMVCMLISCGSTKIIKEDIIWVNSAKVACHGIAPMSCLQIQKGEQIDPNNWEFFYNSIDGFDYQAGSIYKLQVSIEKLDPATVPADASNLKYTLIKVLEKNADQVLQDQDVWLLSHVQGKTVQLANEKQRPTLAIQVHENRISGTGGCNKYSGSIKNVTKQQLTINKGIISTRMACPNMTLENNYFKVLATTATYKIENNTLLLFNVDGVEVLRFKALEVSE